MTVDEAPSTEDYLALASELLADWEQVNGRTEVVVSRGRTSLDYPVLHGLTAHVHRMAAATVTLAGAGMLTEALPLVRSAFECAITAGWAAHFEDGVVALSKESLRQRRTTFDRLQRVDPLLEDTPSSVEAGRILDGMEVDVEGRPRHFDRVCADLVGGPAAYVHFRIFSAHVHATLTCAEQYLFEVEGDPRLHLSPEPKHGLDRAAAALLVGSMVWSRQALLMKEKEVGRQGKFLRDVARRGQVRLKLDLTDTAFVERGRAASARRRAKRESG